LNIVDFGFWIVDSAILPSAYFLLRYSLLTARSPPSAFCGLWIVDCELPPAFCLLPSAFFATHRSQPAFRLLWNVD
jgi:hypothetical protein